MVLRKLAVVERMPRIKPRQEKELVRLRPRNRRKKMPKAKMVDMEIKGDRGARHIRTLAHGEIIERIRLSLDVMFTETIPVDERHHPYGVNNLLNMIREDVEPWVRRYSQNKEFKLIPSQVLRALHTMKRRGFRFRIDNENDAVKLLRKGESLTIHHELVKRA